MCCSAGDYINPHWLLAFAGLYGPKFLAGSGVSYLL